VDREVAKLIHECAFPLTSTAPPGRGERALAAILDDEAIPNPTPWFVRPVNEQEGGEHTEVYLLVEGGLYRLRAPIGPINESASECAYDFVRIGRETRFSLAVVVRLVENTEPLSVPPNVWEIVRTWRFNLGGGESLEVQTSELKRPDVEQTDEMRERDKFARALACAITKAS
jgi:hypothetical protein